MAEGKQDNHLLKSEGILKREGIKRDNESYNEKAQKEWQFFLDEAYEDPAELALVEERLEKRIKHDQNRKRALFSSLTTVAAALLFVLLVNTNSAFAHTVSNIPLIGQLIDYIKFDKSLSHAVENEYVQAVNLTAWDGEEQLSLPYVLADEKNMVLFFQLPEDFELADNEWANISLKDMRDGRTGEKVEGFGYSSASLSQDGMAENHGFIMQHYRFAEGKVPESIALDVLLEIEVMPRGEVAVPVGKFEEDNYEPVLREVGTFTFHVEFAGFAEPIVYKFNENFNIYGQSITLEEMRVYPTGTEVSFTFDPENTAWVKGLNLAVEEDREIVLKGSDGISAMNKEDQSGMSVFIESDYFKKPKKQELMIRGLRLLDKDKEFITVDMENKTITPAIEGMELKEVIKGEGKANLVFGIKVREDESFGAFNFEYQDEEGNAYRLKSEGTSSPIDSWMETRITVEYPESGKIILQRELTPMLMLEEPIRIQLPQR